MSTGRNVSEISFKATFVKFTSLVKLSGSLQSQTQYTGGSIKNIHLSYFRNLKFVFSFLICRSSVFCILALGSGQRLLYRLGSGLRLVLVLVLRFYAYCDGGVYS